MKSLLKIKLYEMECEFKETIKILKEKKEKLIKQLADIKISEETANLLLNQIYDLDKKLEEYYIKLEKGKYNIYKKIISHLYIKVNEFNNDKKNKKEKKIKK